MVWRSLDGGKKWSKGIVINDVPGAPTEGLHCPCRRCAGQSLCRVAGQARRPMAPSSTAPAPPMAARPGRRSVMVYQSPEGTICECCHPSLAIDADGQTAGDVAQRAGRLARHVSGELARRRDFLTPEKLGNGTWKLNACPMDGGGLAGHRTKTITAWRRGEDVFLAEPGRQEAQIGTGKDVALALNGDRAYVSWTKETKVEVWSDGKRRIFPARADSPLWRACRVAALLPHGKRKAQSSRAVCAARSKGPNHPTQLIARMTASVNSVRAAEPPTSRVRCCVLLRRLFQRPIAVAWRPRALSYG